MEALPGTDLQTGFAAYRASYRMETRPSVVGSKTVGTINTPWIVRFEVFMAVTVKNDVFWDVTPCGSCKNRRFERTYPLHNRVKRISVLETTSAVTSINVVFSSLTIFTLMMEAILSSETSALTRATRRHIPEDGIFHSHRHENLNPTYWSLFLAVQQKSHRYGIACEIFLRNDLKMEILRKVFGMRKG
jgi:hypothetical protein